MNDDPLAALVAAWMITVIAMTLLGSALAVASVWNTAIYSHALLTALSSEL